MDKEEFDIQDLKFYIKLSAKEKLEYLEQMNLFLLKITPQKSIAINDKLKDEGF